MAEFGVHLTALVGETPSIFEVLATEGLSHGLKLAFQHFISVLAQNNPDRYGVLHGLKDELYLLIDFFVQYYHLKKYNASFAENFYGLRRTSTSNIGMRQTEMTKHQFTRSLFLLVALPYLHNALLKIFIKLRDECNNQSNELQWKKLLLTTYPYLCFMSGGVSMAYQLLYAVGQAKIHSPLMQLAQCQLRTLTTSDLDAINKEQNDSSQQISPLRCAFNRGAQVLSSSMSVGAFFLQFIDWWYSHEGTQKSIGSKPIPNPPTNRSSYRAGICPICNKQARNETVLTISGYVFCYRCIHQSLTEIPCCPVTKYPATHQQLVKLYPPTD